MRTCPFSQVDLFAPAGRPSQATRLRWSEAVGLDDRQMAATDGPAADYRLPIFTRCQELAFAGHTRPSAAAMLGSTSAGSSPRKADSCRTRRRTGRDPAGRHDAGLPGAGPAVRRRGGRGDADSRDRFARGPAGPRAALQLGRHGPGWLGAQLRSAQDVLGLRPDFVAMRASRSVSSEPTGAWLAAEIGADYEVRAFCPEFAVPEGPVTRSLNSGLALRLTRQGHLPSNYVARQGTATGRDGRVRIRTDESGDIRVGGACHTLVEGTLTL